MFWRPRAKDWLKFIHTQTAFTFNRIFHIQDIYLGWMQSVGRKNKFCLNDLREPTTQPFIFDNDLKDNFHFKEFVH